MSEKSQSTFVHQLKNVFTIDCGDIYLREFTISDVDDIYSISNQSEIFKYLPDWKSSREQRLNWVANYEIPSNNEFLKTVANKEKIENHHLKLGIILKETSQFIGWCCTGVKDELPDQNREIMYAVSEQFHNKGYATKAAKGLINYLFSQTNIELLNAVARMENQSSNKVIEKCGFSLIGTIQIDGELYNHYKLGKNDCTII
ncbi:GNAT family N-acetyltransferase [Lysinibacillus sp. SGAir0095]|uniref:GNAT family N-acetyltransferase n=1 Tax=Lysinibacillus sp. SGAir0095 TaxID=2070463 RepID=UPI0010CCBF09|nr:GNAT family N-acetyltransferase [Lysinibacillus sp. SGAir0095]QCR31151.1 GNAT family N-acetyltransferase [Lysinibacillus sp. SGAir0095]